MNEKGQTLVLFVIIIPVITFIFIYLFEIGTIKVDKKKVVGAIEEALEYGVNNLESQVLETNIKDIIMTTDKDIKEEDIVINLADGGINIIVTMKCDKLIINENIVFNYTGTLVDKNVEIIENRG